MKTKKLIELLQKADPEGECEVCVDNEDILGIHKMEAYWDGTLEVMECGKHEYDIVKAKYTTRGFKIKIYHESIHDRIFYDPDLEVDYSELGYTIEEQRESFRIEDEKVRKEARRFHKKLDLEG